MPYNPNNYPPRRTGVAPGNVGCIALGSLFLGGAAAIIFGAASCEPSSGKPSPSATAEAGGNPNGGDPNWWDNTPSETPTVTVTAKPKKTRTPSSTPTHRHRHHDHDGDYPEHPHPQPGPEGPNFPPPPDAGHCRLVLDTQGNFRMCQTTTAYEYGMGANNDGHTFVVYAGQWVTRFCQNVPDQSQIRTVNNQQIGWVPNGAIPAGTPCR